MAAHELRSYVAGELLTVADELNEESQATINRLVQEAARKIEQNLQKTINKRFDQLAATLTQQTDHAISMQCSQIATELRIKQRQQQMRHSQGSGLQNSNDVLEEQLVRSKQRLASAKLDYKTMATASMTVGSRRRNSHSFQTK